MTLASFLRRNDIMIIHVHFINSIVSFSSIDLSENSLTKLIVRHKVTNLLLSNKFVKISIELDVIVPQ